MALLEEVLDPPVGPGYHSAARRRREAGLPASSGTRTLLMLVTCLALGLLGSIAAVTLRTPDPAAAEGRAQLIERIQAAETAGDEQRQQIEVLRAEIVDLERAALEGNGSAEGPPGELIAEAGLQAGGQALQGPGVVVVLDDAVRPDAAPGEPEDPEAVNARDVQLVVNALWSAGAEAIAVNGHRLTSTSAIRSAGRAIIVDFRGLARPYEVVAIGDPQTLATETSTGLVGAYLAELRTQLGLRAEVTTSEELTVPAAARLTTREGHAVRDPAPEDEPTPGAPPTTAPPRAPASGTPTQDDPTQGSLPTTDDPSQEER